MGEHSRPRGKHGGQAQAVSRAGLTMVIAAVLAICGLLGTTGEIVSNMVSDSRPSIGIAVRKATVLPSVQPAPAVTHHVTRRKISHANTTRLYSVRAGDCLWAIAGRQLGSNLAWKVIARANDLRAPWIIHPGQELKL